MQKHQVEINLTKLKEAVGKYWGYENKDKYFRTYTDQSGVEQTILIADCNITEPKYATKKDGSKIESATSVLHDTGFMQISEKVGEEWTNTNFASLKRWVEKVDTTPPTEQESQEITEEELADSIPF